MTLASVIKLFESRQTCDLSDRHASSINQLCKQYMGEEQRVGFWYKDLPDVAKVFDLCYASIQKGKVSARNCSLK